MTRRLDYLAISLGSFAVAGAALVMLGCTTMGVQDGQARLQIDFGEPVTVRVCGRLDTGITTTAAAALLEAAWTDEGVPYGIRFALARTTAWSRPAYSLEGIMQGLAREPLASGCDRVLAFLRWRAGDIAHALFWPKAHGAAALSHAYVLVGSPAVLQHELYHLLGYEHDPNRAACYGRIAALKRAQVGDFFPAWSRSAGRAVRSRHDVTRLLQP